MQSPHLGAPLGQAAPDKARRPQVALTLDPPPKHGSLVMSSRNPSLTETGGLRHEHAYSTNV